MHPLFHPLFVDYLAYFNSNQDYFECHEVLEHYWKDVAPGEKLHPLVGYVQLATGMYHWRRENFAGAARIFKKAQRNFEVNEASPFFEHIAYKELVTTMAQLPQRIEAKKAFTPFQITITSAELQQLVDCKVQELAPVDAQFLLHKHTLRDRSDVLNEREKSKQLRLKKRT